MSLKWEGVVENFCAENMIEEKGKIAQIDSVTTQVFNKIFVDAVLNRKKNFPMTAWRHAHKKDILDKITECLDQKPVYSLDHLTRGWKNYKLMSTRENPKEIIPRRKELKELRRLLKRDGYTSKESTKMIKSFKKKYEDARK